VVTELLLALGYPSPSAEITRRIADANASADTAVFVAESAKHVVGVVSIHCLPLFHANGFLGRITSLVVSPESRQRGVGRLLVTAAEEFARKHGCARVELTSGDRRPDAHTFYESLGYRRTSQRFIKDCI
jgi:GNAT superfamily N-acetyltransferase